MSTAPPDSATISDTVLRAPRSWVSENQSHLIGDLNLPSANRILGSQPAAIAPRLGTKDIDTPTPQTKGLYRVAGEPPTATPYSTAKKIPYLRKATYVFPEANSRIDQPHKVRYPALKEIFKKNIESNSTLCGYAAYISYELRMCGSCEADAVPSILICCPSRLLKKIRSLLTQPHIRSQFEPETPTSTLVRFGLFFWARTIEMLAFHNIAVVTPREQDSGDSVADAVVERVALGLQVFQGNNSEQRTATIGCVIQVGGDRFGLTTAHAFDRPLATASGMYGVDSIDSDTDDKDYDMSMEQGDIDEFSMAKRLMSSDKSHGQAVQLGNCQVQTAPPPGDTSMWTTRHANLDWALIELGFNEDRLPNYTTTVEALPIVKILPQKCTDVLIITQDLPEIPAILYNIPSYIGGVKGSPAAEVWTVGCLSREYPIRKGQSGSIVVDAESGKLYGMVMAANPFGDIHIVPFAAILAQVKEFFDNDFARVLGVRWRRSSQGKRGEGSEKVKGAGSVKDVKSVKSVKEPDFVDNRTSQLAPQLESTTTSSFMSGWSAQAGAPRVEGVRAGAPRERSVRAVRRKRRA